MILTIGDPQHMTLTIGDPPYLTLIMGDPPPLTPTIGDPPALTLSLFTAMGRSDAPCPGGKAISDPRHQ